VSSLAFLVGAGFAALVALVFAVPSAGLISFVAALCVAALMSLLWIALCRHLVGGQSGDLIGALQALIEICTLVVFCAFL
jgi:adenosylcobinamide-GDP ribazoletransferase